MNIHATGAFDVTIRQATADDAYALADLINFAGQGLPLYLWKNMAEPGETAWEVGRRRAVREEGGFSYRNAVVFDTRGGVAAALVGYPLADTPQPVDYADMPTMFVPLQELENLVPATWYVNVLAAYPQWRGRGLGTRLLAAAETLAIKAGKHAMSLIVSDANPEARRLYERCGYGFVAERPMIKEDWDNPGTAWVLLRKDL